MIRLKYNGTVAGAPDEYGGAADILTGADGGELQGFPRRTKVMSWRSPP